VGIVAQQDQNKRRFAAYLAGLFAVLACPCHIPIYAVLLSGTAAGAFLTLTNPLAWALFSVVFLLSLITALRLLKSHQIRQMT